MNRTQMMFALPTSAELRDAHRKLVKSMQQMRCDMDECATYDSVEPEPKIAKGDSV